jgi:hypothetical protein
MGMLLYHIRHVNWPCKGNERKSTCSGCRGKPGQFPAPSPSSVMRAEGEGGGMAGRVLLGDPERGRGGYSGKSIQRAVIAPDSGKENLRAGVALEFGKLFWQIFPASHLGKPLRHINLVGSVG